MTDADPLRLSIAIDGAQPVSGLLQGARRAKACLILAHGAGAGMTHPYMAMVANGLAERGVATLRYQFLYMERGSRRPDGPKLAHAAVRAAVAEASRRLPDVPLVAGGKSFGGRMTSQAQAAAPMAGVRGIAFIGFPLHPAGKPADDRGKHLFEVEVPMLFLQGSRDELADLGLVQSLVEKLDARATLRVFDGADHSFHVPARSGRTDAQVHSELLDALVSWIDRAA